ncbi:MAG: VUT family protein [Gemmatimonadetes bacterium]|nr:MAG: VUT family protein [Gemmatimonadota bacterium]
MILPNELLWIGFLLMDFTIALLVYRFFKKEGLFLLIVANIVLCNLQVLKMVELFGITVSLGNILYGSIFFATDLLGEVYGKKEARRGVTFGFLTLFYMTIIMQVTLLFQPAEADFAHESMTVLFGFVPRIAIASLIAYYLSQMHDVWAFHFWKIKTEGKYLWLRNNASTLVSQAIDSTIFVFIAFWGVFDLTVFWQILITTYLMKVVVAAIDTPFLYLAKRFAEPEEPLKVVPSVS